MTSGHLYRASYHGTQPTTHTSRDAALAHVDDLARNDANGRYWDWERDGDTDVQVWTAPLTDRPTSTTGGTVAPVADTIRND